MALSSFAGNTSMDVPQTQNTAPVLEYRCLYTHDLRRKQKRWQDGRLKFHTFNKRVMVYDERSNYIGDTHWREDSAFDEGEELELERGGILVEVGECVGKRDQDLSQLVDKRLKDREERAAAKVAASSPSRPHPSLVRTFQATPGPLQHKPLNALLTNTGHYGRAVIPNTSPFEEKQRLRNGNHDGPDDGRPAKRRKPNENAPSKSGYAQNLMGATLSLASSRPPSTATIRYEPVRAKPSVTEPPAPAVDLTSDNDEDEEQGIGTSRASVGEERVSKDRRDKGQRRLKRSPARSGYASNLTGVSLTLSRPDKISARRSKKILPISVSTRLTQQENSECSSETEEDSFIDIESVAMKLPAVSKSPKEVARKIDKAPKRTSTPKLRSSSLTLVDDPIPMMEASYSSDRKQAKPRKRLPTVENRSSSPTMAKLPTPKPTKTLQKPTAQKASPAITAPKSVRSLHRPSLQNSSAVVPTPEPPASLLRIKARPPRKMMMLMDRPSSRASGTTESSSTSRHKPKPQQNSGLDSSEVVPSQATLHLNSFCQRQDEIIQARLNGKRTALNLEDILSSPEDSGIDHQTIDLLLSRKSLPAETKLANEQNLTKLKSQGSSSGKQIERFFPVEDSVANVLLSQPEKTSSVASNSAIDDPNNHKESYPIVQDHSLELKRKGGRDIPTFHNCALQNESTSGSQTVAPTTQILAVARKEKEQRISSKVPRSPPTTSKLPENFSSAIQAATDHFRAIIKSSAGSEVKLGGAIVPRLEKTVEVEQTHSVPLLHQKEQTASSEVAVKSPPRSSLVGEVSSIETEQLVIELEPGEALSDSFQKAVDPAANARLETPKTRLINPATRGKSLQSIAANTVDSLAPAFSLMPPPPPLPAHRFTTRPQKNLERNVVAEDRPPPSGYDGNRTTAGPWSRESYDLFGSWLPPGGLVNVAQANKG
ncbi:hypothetical protein N431DRAFT_430735 [Stipitochalara longipes BDJ]|nr:hypothetical protein N431DRAFT_430735 [Stipitochalara longipes BDJ]